MSKPLCYLVCLMLLNGLALVASSSGQEKAGEPKVLSLKPVEVLPGDDELRKLQKERFNAAVSETQANVALYQSGRVTLDTTLESAKHVVLAGTDMVEKPADKIAMLEMGVEVARHLERIVKDRHDNDVEPRQALARATYQRCDWEIQLLRARRDAKAAE